MQRTPVAVLGTLAQFHREPIPYDLAALVRLVTDLRPDLLCLHMTSEQWRRRDSSELPPEWSSSNRYGLQNAPTVRDPLDARHPVHAKCRKIRCPRGAR
jgi:hypothetical protein